MTPNTSPGFSGLGGRTELDQCGAPAAELWVIQRERNHLRMFFQNRMHGAPQVANAFAVNNAQLKNSARLAFRQVIVHEVFYFTRIESVQIQHPVNWQFDRFVSHVCQ